MSRLIEEFDLTHEEIAKALGRSRVSVTNFLRLLELSDGRQGRADGRRARHGPRASAAAARRGAASAASTQGCAPRLVGAKSRADGARRWSKLRRAARNGRQRSTFRRAGSSGSSRASSARKSRSAPARRATTCCSSGSPISRTSRRACRSSRTWCGKFARQPGRVRATPAATRKHEAASLRTSRRHGQPSFKKYSSRGCRSRLSSVSGVGARGSPRRT